MKKILVFCDFYLPGYKSGGGMWTVVHLVDRFADRYDFYVVTRNYESKGDRTPYTTVQSGAWNEVGNAKVFYLAPEHYGLRNFVSIVSDVVPDAVFLNSAFSLPVVRFLTARRKKLIDPVPVVLAPCGEMSSGARSVKPLKKKIFLAYAKAFGLYQNVVWKASSKAEAEDIREVTGPAVEIHIAPDLAPKSILPDFDLDEKPVKTQGSVRLIFLSRIVKVKNLRYCLERLSEIRTGQVSLDILGPVEDNEYWEGCLSIIETLPANIKVNAEATFVSNETGLQRMQESHFLILPTLSENFGYIFLESMAAGTPPIISDNTVWNELERRNAGWEIPLEKPALWSETIRKCIEMDNDAYGKMATNAREYALNWLGNDETENLTASLLQTVIEGGRGSYA